nr:MAG TPA: hypothetical protein [Caudoviricetes sp.]
MKTFTKESITCAISFSSIVFSSFKSSKLNA